MITGIAAFAKENLRKQLNITNDLRKWRHHLLNHFYLLALWHLQVNIFLEVIIS